MNTVQTVKANGGYVVTFSQSGITYFYNDEDSSGREDIREATRMPYAMAVTVAKRLRANLAEQRRDARTGR